MVYRITIEESATREFEIEADSLHEALEMGKAEYGSILGPLSDDDVSYQQIMAYGPDEDGEDVKTAWEEI